MCFFFSSRRRHTRWPRDWSSDVCSSDLRIHLLVGTQRPDAAFLGEGLRDNFDTRFSLRSEERRVGKGGDATGRSIIKRKFTETTEYGGCYMDSMNARAADGRM